MLANDGVMVTVNGDDHIFRGGLLLWLRDNLASNTVGGFKETFYFSFRFCRTCYVTNNQYKTLSNVSEIELCSKRKHCSECDVMEGPLFDHYTELTVVLHFWILAIFPCFMED